MSPFVSVVLPVYNGQRYLRQAIESVLAQSYSDFEFIIRDDQSTDESRQIIEGYSDSRIRKFANDKNQGLFRTLNLTIKEAKGEWVRLWSQDDVMRPNCLQAETEFIRQHPEVGMVYCARDIIDENGQVIIPAPVYATPNIISPELAAQIMFYHGSITGNIANVMLKREALEQVGLFREDMRISGDFEMWARITEKYPIGYIDEPLIDLRSHTGQFSQAKGSLAISINEDQDIYQALMKRLPPEIDAYARKYHRWHRGPMYLHYMVRCLVGRDFESAARSYRAIKKMGGNPILLAGFWLLTANQRLYRMKPKFGNQFASLNN